MNCFMFFIPNNKKQRFFAFHFIEYNLTEINMIISNYCVELTNNEFKPIKIRNFEYSIYNNFRKEKRLITALTSDSYKSIGGGRNLSI